MISLKSFLIIILIFLVSFHNAVNEKNQLSHQQKFCFQKWDSLKKADTSFKSKRSTTFICECLKGSYMDDFQFKPVNGDSQTLYSIKKPILIFLFAAYCGPCIAEIPAINEVAKKYSSKIEFIGISLDNLTLLHKYQSKYYNKISLVPSSPDNLSIKNWVFKYFSYGRKMLPIPTVYYVNDEKEIIDISVGAEMDFRPKNKNTSFSLDFTKYSMKEITNEEVNKMNIESLEQGIHKILINK